MGRELKRVPLDFDWPLNKVWHLYLNPHPCADTCAHCDGSGYSETGQKFKAQWYGTNQSFTPAERGSKSFLPSHPVIRALAGRSAPHVIWSLEAEAERLAEHFNRGWSHHLNADDVAALLKEGRLMDFSHTWTKGDGWKRKEPVYVPTPEQVNEWSLSGFGHDSINQHICVEARCASIGVSSTCAHCNGSGEIWRSPEAKKIYDNWEPSEPPVGIGYQIWETVSEGSPISPVFATPEELADYMAGNPRGTDAGTSRQTWLSFINGPGWALSMVSDEKGLRTGVEAAVDHFQGET